MNGLEHTYESAFASEPFLISITQRLLNTKDPFWTVGEWDIVIPAPKPRRATTSQQMVRDLKAWTNWSSRQLAAVLQTSHTTIRRLEAGRPLVVGHSGDLRRRLTEVHDVIARVARAADNSPTRIADSLAFERSPGESAIVALTTGDMPGALMRALDRLRPRPAGLLVGTGVRRDGATAALHE